MTAVCLMQQLVQKSLEKVKLKCCKQDYDGDDNSKAGTKVFKRNDCFSFDIQEDSLVQYKEGEIPTNTAKNTKMGLSKFWILANRQKCKMCRRSREIPRWHSSCKR